MDFFCLYTELANSQEATVLRVSVTSKKKNPSIVVQLSKSSQLPCSLLLRLPGVYKGLSDFHMFYYKWKYFHYSSESGRVEW